MLLRFDGVDEQNTEMTVGFRSPGGKVDMPDSILHVDMKPRDDLRPVFRPTTAPAKLAPPYKIDPDERVVYETYLANEQGERFAVGGATVGFSHERDGEVASAETEEVDGEVDLRRSPPVVLKEGIYDVLVRFETEDGNEPLIELPRQLLVAQSLARVVLAYDLRRVTPALGRRS